MTPRTNEHHIKFQSTHSLRSATALDDLDMVHMWFQSTHSLRSATMGDAARRAFNVVSIHALLAECDGDDPRNTN